MTWFIGHPRVTVLANPPGVTTPKAQRETRIYTAHMQITNNGLLEGRTGRGDHVSRAFVGKTTVHRVRVYTQLPNAKWETYPVYL